MLDRKAFVTEMHALADRFNRQVSDEMTRRYFEDLQALTTEQFLAAARTIYRNDQFWPPPVRFLEVAGVDPTSEAERAWEFALSEARQGVSKPLDQYDPAHAAALKVVGKNRGIGLTSEGQLPWVKKDFIRAFKQHREQGGLPELEKPEPVTLPGLGS